MVRARVGGGSWVKGENDWGWTHTGWWGDFGPRQDGPAAAPPPIAAPRGRLSGPLAAMAQAIGHDIGRNKDLRKTLFFYRDEVSGETFEVYRNEEGELRCDELSDYSSLIALPIVEDSIAGRLAALAELADEMIMLMFNVRGMYRSATAQDLFKVSPRHVALIERAAEILGRPTPADVVPPDQDAG